MVIDCPVCNGKKTAESTTKTSNIPHFGEILESSLICSACGYKHNDVICLEQKDPIKLTLTINKDTISSRVVKSQSATVTIPELGLKVEPGPKSLGYVSNVEGVISRFENVVKQALAIFEDEESQKNGLAIIEKLELLANGETEATLIIEDPFGQSNIMDINVKKDTLTDEELKHLKTGFTIIEESSLE
ncbi:MAG: ZPR1 zinc finger domain-containing protein [Methanobrevibacter sp.]|nr:ZPR1 zinc finger domain-containing protein [Methanobrevibacter sp.]